MPSGCQLLLHGCVDIKIRNETDYRVEPLKWLLIIGGLLGLGDALVGDEAIRKALSFSSCVTCLALVPYLLKTQKVRNTMFASSLVTGCVYLGDFAVFSDAHYFALGLSIPFASAIFLDWKDAATIGGAYLVIGSCIGAMLHLEALTPVYASPPVLDKTIAIAGLSLVMAGIAIWKEKLFKEAAEHEAQQRSRFETICDNGYGALVEADATGKIVFLRGALLGELGYSNMQLLGRDQESLLIREDLLRLRRQAEVDGDDVKYDLEVRLLDADQNRRWARLSGGTIRCKTGERRWINAVQDIQADVECRQRANDVSRCNSLADVCAGVSHDFNNLLTAMSLHADAIEDPQIRHEILIAQRQASNLTAGLLTFARKQEFREQDVKMDLFLEELKPPLQRSAPDNVRVHWNINPTKAIVRVDPSQLEQVFVNLSSNAYQAMPHGGDLTIEAREKQIDRDTAKSHNVKPGSYVEIICRDTGCGMDVATASRAIEPFFTTKPRGTGTGLGLATVHGVMQRSAGILEIRSVRNQGTEISLLLPIHAKEGKSSSDQPDEKVVHPIGLNVALVEDREIVGVALKMLLESEGFRVQLYADADSAWAEIVDGVDFELLISDIILPGMNGVDLLQRCLARNPNLRAILISGHQKHDLSVVTENPESIRFIAKPFDSRHLLSVAHKLIGMPREPLVARQAT